LRGKASDADEHFVAKLAAAHGLEFFLEQENVAAKAKRERRNVEDAGRRARYAWFERLVKEGRVARVMVAHTADDQAETVLAHILRGTGIAGLAAIHPETGCVFRPLLSMRRAELREYLRWKQQTWREDASNKDIKRTRAKIRSQLLPQLEKKFNPRVVEHLCQLAELAREDNEHLESHVALRLTALAKKRESGFTIGIHDIAMGTARPGQTNEKSANRAWRDGARAIAKRMVRQLVKRIKPQSGELGAKHVEVVLQLAASGHSGQILQLPGGVEIRRERVSLEFRAAQGGNQETEAAGFSREVRLPGTGQALRFDIASHILQLRVIDWPQEGRETTEWRVVLDRARLREPLVLRPWQPGDRMRPAGHQKRHTLARLLNELGRTRWEKQTWPVLESAGQVAWTLGLPVAEEFAVRQGSRTGVVITEESAR
jgi:tRNA(Ile)-lysidine synthase